VGFFLHGVLEWCGTGLTSAIALRFISKIHLRVPIGRARAGMTQIVTDRRQVIPRLQERHRGAMPHTVRVKPLVAESRSIVRSTGKAPGEDVTDPEPSQGSAVVIQKHASL